VSGDAEHIEDDLLLVVSSFFFFQKEDYFTKGEFFAYFEISLRELHNFFSKHPAPPVIYRFRSA